MSSFRKVPVTISLTPHQMRIINEDAQRLGISMPAMVRSVVDRYIENTHGFEIAMAFVSTSVSASAI